MRANGHGNLLGGFGVERKAARRASDLRSRCNHAMQKRDSGRLDRGPIRPYGTWGRRRGRQLLLIKGRFGRRWRGRASRRDRECEPVFHPLARRSARIPNRSSGLRYPCMFRPETNIRSGADSNNLGFVGAQYRELPLSAVSCCRSTRRHRSASCLREKLRSSQSRCQSIPFLIAGARIDEISRQSGHEENSCPVLRIEVGITNPSVVAP